MKYEPKRDGNQTVWPLRIYPDPLQAVTTLGKTVEGRVPDPSEPRKQYGTISAGDAVQFILRQDGESTPTTYAYTVDYVRHYDTIKAMLEAEGIERVLPRVASVAEGVELYHSFGGYEQRAADYGVHAIGLGQRVDAVFPEQ